MIEGDWGEVISYLDRLIWASEDDCWERRSWYWNDKFGGAGEIGVVGGDSSWELLKGGDKLLKGGDGWVGEDDMERQLLEFWVKELDESKSEGGVEPVLIFDRKRDKTRSNCLNLHLQHSFQTHPSNYRCEDVYMSLIWINKWINT